ncbi:MAG: molybdopterin-dependent oxidoreductase [Anaerolineales bacterium]|nr:molybdopterin-dependent oxidoreductase [Anaerolineales bacterium]
MADKPFGKHPDFIVREMSPFNGGPPLNLLVENQLTPTELFFSRNHGDIPEVDAASYRLEVSGLVEQPLTFSLAELTSRFPSVDAAATLQCAGNRRQELIDRKPIPNELPWGAEAISHAAWRGLRLSDVLAAAGLAQGAAHVEFIGLDETERHGERFNFGGSIPLKDALSGEVLLAYEMNAAPLEPVHGFPLRVVAPGIIGARSVKWLKEIRVQPEPSHNYFQRVAYRLFPPDVDSQNVVWEQGMMLNENSLTSVICTPAESENPPAGAVTVRGYALAGGERSIARVELSADGGRSWTQCELLGEDAPGIWRLWQAQLDLALGEHELVVRAVDSAANAQPPDVEQIWNFKGYMNSAWHRQKIEIKQSD